MTDSSRQRNTDALVAAIVQMGAKRRLGKDAQIYAQGETAAYVCLVVTGSVSTSRLMSDGRRQVGDFYLPGEVFGLETGETHRFSAEALRPCELILGNRAALNSLAEDRELERAMWRAMSRELDRAQEHLALLGRKTACERVATLLADVASRSDGAADLPMGRQDMADYLGLTIETVSRTLTQLQGSRVVEFAGFRRFRVSNPTALERLAA